MKLLKITVNNFRQFYGINTIELSKDNKKNITLIHGENGLGKTTLLNAVLWCFYERFTSDFENENEIINLFSLTQGNLKSFVEIYFSHESKEFYIKREYSENTKSNEVIVYEIENGSFNKPIKLIAPFIESVIPSQMADYFFFHGEGIANITNTNNVTKFRKAIRDILGFTSAEYAKEDLNELIIRRKNEIHKLTKKDSEYNTKYKLKNDLEYEKIEKTRLKKECSEYIENTEIEIGILNERLTKIKVFNVSDIQKNKSDAVQRKINLEKNECLLLDRSKKLITKYGITLFGHRLANETMLYIEEREILGEIPSPYDESLINKILDAKSCICGRPIIPSSLEYDNIKALRNKANTADIKKRRLAAIHYAGSIGNISEKPQDFIIEYNQIDKDLAIILRDKQLVIHEIDNFQQQLDDIGDGGQKEVASINQQIKSLSLQKENAKIKINNLEQAIVSLNSKINEYDRWLNANTPDNSLVLKYSKEIEKITNLVSICDSKLKLYESIAKKNIVTSVNVILNNFSRKDFSVRVTDNFDFKLARKDGSLVAKSKGENLLLNLSFVSALLGFCAQRATGDNRFLIKGTVAPFFIDAPFGELDDTYRQATALFLPECCEQLILLLSSSHWSGTVDQAIQDKVGKEYLIVSHKIDRQNEKPNDVIKIGGVDYKQSIYEAEIEGSIIKEI